MKTLLYLLFVFLLPAPSALAQHAASHYGSTTATEASWEGERTPAPSGGVDADVIQSWSGDPMWISGWPLTRGRYFDLAESSIGPEGDVPIRLVFSSEIETLAQTFRPANRFEATGVGIFPGAAYDMSDPEAPRRLNICFGEFGDSPDFVWNTAGNPIRRLDYLLIMASDYDGTGETYAGVEFRDPQDVLYGQRAFLAPGATILEADPSSITVDLARIADLSSSVPTNGQVELSWAYAPPAAVETLRLYTGLNSPPTDILAELPPGQTTYTHTVSKPELRHYRLESLDAGGEVVDVSLETSAHTFISQGVTLLGHLDPHEGASDAYHGDVWGHVDATTGSEYALLTDASYISSWSGLRIIALDGPTLEEVGFVDSDGPLDVKTYEQYAYLSHEFAPTLVVDLSDPTSPQIVGEIDVQPGASEGGSHNILIEGDYLYAVGGRSPGGLRIFDLAADPIAPPLIGAFAGADSQTYYHDLAVRGDTAYVAAIYGHGVDVLDLSDRANPSLITTVIYPAPVMGAHNVCTSEDGDTIFVGDEVGSGQWTRAFDVSDLDDVDMISEIIVDEEATVHNCYVTGDTLHLAHYSLGYQAFDISDPANPERLAFYDGYGTGDDERAWTAYPFLPSGRIIVSDINAGLLLLELDGSVVSNEPHERALPLALSPPYPNPTAGAATLRYTLAAPAHVRVTLFDALGRTVAVLAEGERAAGEHTTVVATDGLANGVYFARLTVDGQRMTRPLTVQR